MHDSFLSFTPFFLSFAHPPWAKWSRAYCVSCKAEVTLCWPLKYLVKSFQSKVLVVSFIDDWSSLVPGLSPKHGASSIKQPPPHHQILAQCLLQHPTFQWCCCESEYNVNWKLLWESGCVFFLFKIDVVGNPYSVIFSSIQVVDRSQLVNKHYKISTVLKCTGLWVVLSSGFAQNISLLCLKFSVSRTAV